MSKKIVLLAGLLCSLFFFSSNSLWAKPDKSSEKSEKQSVGNKGASKKGNKGKKGEELKLNGKTAIQLIRESEDKIRGKSSITVFKMKIIRPSWTRTLKMKAWSYGLDYDFVRILYPQRERGIAFLKIKTQMWNYLPKADMVIKIPPSMMLSSWMGSDFTNDDVVRASSLIRDYTPKLVRIEERGGEKLGVIELTPKPNSPVVWGKILIWIRASDSLPVREEFYTEKGKLVRVMTFSKFRKMDDRVIPTLMRMENLLKKGYITELEILKVKFLDRLPKKIFTLRHLKKKNW